MQIRWGEKETQMGEEIRFGTFKIPTIYPIPFPSLSSSDSQSSTIMPPFPHYPPFFTDLSFCDLDFVLPLSSSSFVSSFLFHNRQQKCKMTISWWDPYRWYNVFLTEIKWTNEFGKRVPSLINSSFELTLLKDKTRSIVLRPFIRLPPDEAAALIRVGHFSHPICSNLAGIVRRPNGSQRQKSLSRENVRERDEN